MFNHVDHGIALSNLADETKESGRTYKTPEGKMYPSVTTVLSILSKEAIKAWRARVGEEEANRVSKRAGTRGTAVHTLAENYLNNVERWQGDSSYFDVMTFEDIKPILDERLNNIWFQEVALYSDRLECAGRVDCIAEFDGELSIIDFKTSLRRKTPDKITNYFMQAAFYAAALYEMTGVKVKYGVIIIAVDDDEPQVFKIKTADWIETFMKVRKVYKDQYKR